MEAKDIKKTQIIVSCYERNVGIMAHCLFSFNERSNLIVKAH